MAPDRVRASARGGELHRLRCEVEYLEQLLVEERVRRKEAEDRLLDRERCLEEVRRVAASKFEQHSLELGEQVCTLKGELARAREMLLEGRKNCLLDTGKSLEECFLQSVDKLLQRLFPCSVAAEDPRLTAKQSWKLVKGLAQEHMALASFKKAHGLTSLDELGRELARLRDREQLWAAIARDYTKFARDTSEARVQVEAALEAVM
jgi:hypothetical protein